MSAPKVTSKFSASGSKRKAGNGSNAPVPEGEKKDTSREIVFLAGGKPDKVAYEKEQDKIQKEVDVLQGKLVSPSHGPLTQITYPLPFVRLPFGKKLTQPINQMRKLTAGMHLRLSSTVSERSSRRKSITGVNCWNRSSLFRTTFRVRYVKTTVTSLSPGSSPCMFHFGSRSKHCKPRNQNSLSNLLTKWINMWSMWILNL